MLVAAALLMLSLPDQAPIDRQALVSRHNVTLTKFNGDSPMQVGNGEFAFGMDVTGLQSFVPFNTMSHWGWNSLPLPPGMSIDQFKGQVWDTHGRPVRYPMPDPDHPELSDWLAGNPHAINLGRLGLEFTKKDGTVATAEDLTNPVQKLDLWAGTVTSHFEIEGVPVTVTTACHPTVDSVAVKVQSLLLEQGKVEVFLDCPGDNGAQFANFVGDPNHPALLQPVGLPHGHRADFERKLTESSYRISLGWSGEATAGPAPKRDPGIEIIKAEYGAQDKWLDVTSKVADFVRAGQLAVRATNDLGADPILGVGKSLKVTYKVAGKTKEASTPENGEITLEPAYPPHQILLRPSTKAGEFSFVCAFSPKPIPAKLPSAQATIEESAKAWPAYWKSGGAIDFSGSTDPRAQELERRLVLSQYLMKVNEAGSLPPQESGLVNNGWFGRFHLEMYWWHAAHWALWNRWPELNRSVGFYQKLLPLAEKRAQGEGYLGAHWPKAIGPGGREWPHLIHSLLMWQQPHPLFFAELDYRAHPTKGTLKKWQSVVDATGDFLASYAFYDKETKRYDLGPPIILASENNPPKTTLNPTYELGYWRFGLRTAQEWRKRLGLPPKPLWNTVLNNLAPLPVQDGVYVLYEGVKDMWTAFNFEHPALTSVLGILPGDGVDVPTMRRTLDKIMATWNFQRTWGWDYPMLAMCAARLGEPSRAVDFLLTSHEGFQFDERGLATGGPFPYFPANGALLYGVAMMAAGWDGSGDTHAPGFPTDGTWTVRYENLSRAP